MKNMKRMLSLVLVLCALCGLAAIPASAATSYDVNKILTACDKAEGTSYTKGHCLGWVNQMFYKTYGFDSFACCAKKYAEQYTDSTDRNTIPLGADVFFSANNAICSTCGRHCGHIGIYVGNGYIMHNWSGKIVKMKITSVESSGYKFIGWGYHGNKTLSGSASASSTDKVGGTTTTLKTGAYYNLVNQGSGKYLNVSCSASGNNVNVNIWEKDGTTGEKYALVKVNSWYTLKPACATSYRVNVYGTTSKSGANICLWKDSKNDTQGWILEAVAGGYVLRSANNTNLALTADSKSNGSNVKLAPYSAGNSYQIWDFKAA